MMRFLLKATHLFRFKNFKTNLPRKKEVGLAFLTMTILFLTFQNCSSKQGGELILSKVTSQQNLGTTSDSSQTANDTNATLPVNSPLPSQSPSPDISSSTDLSNDSNKKESFRNQRPALAVRSIGCIMCHAQINANVVTDFSGFNSAHDFTIDKNPNGLTAWTIYNDNQPRAQINGMLTVPSSFNTIELQGFLNNSPNTQLQTKSQIIIKYPTANYLLGLITTVNSPNYPGYEYFPDSNTMISISDSLSLVNNSHLDNTKEIYCSGDLISTKTIYLRNPIIITSKRGCRLYSTKSIIIDGTISLQTTTEGEQPNLQISSAKSIILGLSTTISGSPSPSNMLTSYFNRINAISDPDFKIDGITKNEFIQSLSSEFESINFQAISTDRNQELSGLLLNAPLVISTYTGNFNGSIIADFALVSIGSFTFTFNDIFADQTVPILPLLNEVHFFKITD
jgi:hypothetical protein